MSNKKVASGSGDKVKDAPKRGMNPFFIWMQENRQRLQKPGMRAGDVSKAAGVEWGKLTDKTEWEKKAADDKKRYEKELADYKE